MNCMKCGAALKAEQVFCEQCLAEMARYPVRPNVVVQLPPQQTASAVKKKRNPKKERKPEDQVRHLRLVIRWLCLLLVAALLAFAFAAYILLQHLHEHGYFERNFFTYATVAQTDVSRETFF